MSDPRTCTCTGSTGGNGDIAHKVPRWAADSLVRCDNTSSVKFPGLKSQPEALFKARYANTASGVCDNSRRRRFWNVTGFVNTVENTPLVCTVAKCTAAARVLPTGVVELEAGWITLGSDITLWERHNDRYQSRHCRVTLLRYQGGAL